MYCIFFLVSVLIVLIFVAAMDIEPPSDPIFKIHESSSENLETLYSLFEGVDDDMDSSVNDVFRVLDSFPDSDHYDSDSSEENDLIYISDVDAAFMLGKLNS